MLGFFNAGLRDSELVISALRQYFKGQDQKFSFAMSQRPNFQLLLAKCNDSMEHIH